MSRCLPFGLNDLDNLPAINSRITKGLIKCPIKGCRFFSQPRREMCPHHHIYTHPGKDGAKCTYVYKDVYDNLLWKEDEDRELLSKVFKLKRVTSKMRHENSEDSLTWNISRAFDRADKINLLTEMLIGKKVSFDLDIAYWTVTRNGTHYNPLIEASEYYGELKRYRTEPDIILSDTDNKALIIIEAKFGSPNFNDEFNRSSRKKDKESRVRRYSKGREFLEADVSEIITAGYYKLMRNWLIGCRMQDTKSFKDFYLINLVRETQEVNIEQEFGKFPGTDKNKHFIRRTWEDIYRNLPSGEDFALLKGYFGNKTLSMNKVFNV